MGKFNDYLNKKEKGLGNSGKAKKTPIELVPDYPGGIVNTPPQGKNAKPYKVGKDIKQMTMKGEKEGTPFAQAGDKSNVYNPCDCKVDPVQGKVVDSWPKTSDAPKPKKTKTEHFIEKTSKMSFSEFNNFMKQKFAIEDSLPHITANEKGKIYPDPTEAIRYAVAVAKASPAVMENLAHEMKRQKATKKLLNNLFDFPETYVDIQKILNDPVYGSRRKNKLTDALTEMVGNPLGFELPSKDKSMPLQDDEDEEGLDLGSDEEESEFGEPDDEEESEFGDEEDYEDEEESEFGDEEENPDFDEENPDGEDYNSDDVGSEDYDDEEEGSHGLHGWPR